jgi:hypothetical protein
VPTFCEMAYIVKVRPARKRPDRNRELDRALKDYLRYMVDFEARRPFLVRDADQHPTEPPLGRPHSTYPDQLAPVESEPEEDSA